MEYKQVELKFKVLGIPRPKQSFIRGKQNYTPERTVKDEVSFRAQLIPQLPEGFIPLDEALQMECLYVFPFPSPLKKKDREYLAKYGVLYKTTKPDVSDNLNKGVCDAMNGVVFIDDARISAFSSVKVYGDIPRVEVKIITLR